MILPESPITGNQNVALFDTFSAKDIINFYNLQEDIDVSRYFTDCREIHLLECLDTGYKFYYPFEIIGDKAFYESLQVESDKKGDGYDREWDNDHKFAAEQIGKDKKVLEIGCGSGKFLSGISDITQNVVGLELNSIAAAAARKKGFDAQTKLIEVFCDEQPLSFDIVCAFQVLEHIADVNPFIESALKLLKPNGKLIFSVPNNEPYFQKFSKYEVLNLPPHHMGLWNLGAFEKLQDFYPLTLDKYQYADESSLMIDAYLRSKSIADIKSLPSALTTFDKLKIYSIMPFALIKSSLDYAADKKNRVHISVVFRKQ